MDSPDKTLTDILGNWKSWIPWRSESANVSRAFWMPDQSCRVCYDCDSQFTLINRRHHCRLCGRVFCAKCTANSILAPSGDPRIPREERERIRVCNYCFKQWNQGIAASDHEIRVLNQDISSSPSAASLSSPRSSGTADSSITFASVPYSFEANQQALEHSGLSPQHSPVILTGRDQQGESALGRSIDILSSIGDIPQNYSMNRSAGKDDYDGAYKSDTEASHSPQAISYFGQPESEEIGIEHGPHNEQLDGENNDVRSLSSSPLQESFYSRGLEGISDLDQKEETNFIYGEDPGQSSLDFTDDVQSEPVDFESNGLLWIPPEPEDEEDERETFYDDDDEGHDAGEWGYLRASSSFGSGEYRSKDRSSEEHKNVMKNVVDGHFRALVAQLLQVENLPLGEISDKESWLEIITSLSWEAATLLKPDMSRCGEMDPGGYVKVKCIASGLRRNSTVVKGVVCKKNVAHRRMISKIEKSRLLILGGALEYQRVSNHLSSFDTLLQQEIDHLKMAVAKIDAHRPDVLLVEKSVSRFAQEYLLAKDISLVLNIKRPLLERIARCTGAQIVPSIDQLSSPKLGYCELFHVERFTEDLTSSGPTGKRSVKTLMFFEGCPKPLGCTILLRGADMDELKKAKRVVQYGVFAAYHLALETSFLADERASLPELPLNSPITVAIPVKSSVVERSISMVPDFSLPGYQGQQPSLPIDEPQRSKSLPSSDLILSSNSTIPFVENGPSSQLSQPSSSAANSTAIFSSHPVPWTIGSESYDDEPSSYSTIKERNALGTRGEMEESSANGYQKQELGSVELLGNDKFSIDSEDVHNAVVSSQPIGSEPLNVQQNIQNQQELGTYKEELGTGKDDFATASSAHQSILVSSSSRCILKGSVCERSHLFRIKYYGTFDKPLGRFLRDKLFNQAYRCDACEMPAEAHVHCYTHRQGTLTISVRKLPEILLPGEREGKIWMWHRCLRCPRNNGFPPATRRVVMSDAAWGLSFGKFLELSFSNHIAASRVASCGHSLHRDCLRFYGYGRMIACFRYTSTDVHSVYLPPSKLDFNYEDQEWIRKEKDEVVNQAELLFSEVLNTLRQIAEKISGARTINSTRKMELRRQIAGLEAILQKEKAKFEESLHKTMIGEGKQGQGAVDILEINYLRRKLLIQAYVWDQQLIQAANLDNGNSAGSFIAESEERLMVDSEKLPEISTNRKLVEDLKSSDSHLAYQQCYEGPSNGKEFVTSSAQPDIQVEEVGDSDADKGEEHLCSTSISAPSETLESKTYLQAAQADGEFSRMVNLSDTLEAAWTGDNGSVVGITKDNSLILSNSTSEDSSAIDITILNDGSEDQNVDRVTHAISPSLPSKALDDTEDFEGYLDTASSNFYYLFNENFLASGQKLESLAKHNPVFLSSFWELEFQGGARLFLPLGISETVVPVYDDEPSSIIAYALMSPEYHSQLIDEAEKVRDCGDSLPSLSSYTDSFFQSSDDFSFDTSKSLGPSDDTISSISGPRTSISLDPLLYPKSLNPRIFFEEYGPHGGVKYSVTCYYAKRFEALRRICCSELDFVKSLSRCKKWGAQGGKSNVFFAKTLDDRFIIKQVTKTELESFIKFAPEYFKYLSESIGTRSPTCLAKILGIYQVTAKHLKGGKESKMDVLVMENLLFRRNVTRLYDLKGSSRSRYNADSTGNNKVLLDQNLIEAMCTSPIFVGNKAKRLLERAVWNDTSFLASIGVMDYSLLVGVDEEKHELVIGIIDFMRQYTWDKHLETWVKATGILGGAKNSSPTVISPKEYKKRFRKAMTTYFLMVPDQWFPQSIVPSQSQSDFGEENMPDGKSDAVSPYVVLYKISYFSSNINETKFSIIHLNSLDSLSLLPSYCYELLLCYL